MADEQLIVEPPAPVIRQVCDALRAAGVRFELKGYLPRRVVITAPAEDMPRLREQLDKITQEWFQLEAW